VVRWNAVNAFAFPFGRRIAFTSGCLALLDDDELSAVAAHEIGHLAEPLPVQLARVVLLLAVFPLLVIQLAGLLATIGLALAVLVLARLFRRIARRMEERADRAALGGADASPVYARALERICQANLMPVVMPGRPVHPHLYDRLVAAGAAPAYPRPEPPSRRRTRLALAAGLALLLTAAIAPVALRGPLEAAAAVDERASDLRIALGPVESLVQRAELEASRGHSERALSFARAALALDSHQADAWTLIALTQAGDGACDAAAYALGWAGSVSTGGWDAPDVLEAMTFVADCEPATRLSSAL
jgi:predicted Zn-dependent protease